MSLLKIAELEGQIKRRDDRIIELEATVETLTERNALFVLDILDDNTLANLAAERAGILQAITDQENQPSQFGTVTMAIHEAIEAERDALKADAERYRWLRDQNADLAAGFYVGDETDALPEDITWVGSDLDAAVDLAMKGTS